MLNGSENERHEFENLQVFSRSEILAARVRWEERHSQGLDHEGTSVSNDGEWT